MHHDTARMYQKPIVRSSERGAMYTNYNQMNESRERSFYMHARPKTNKPIVRAKVM